MTPVIIIIAFSASIAIYSDLGVVFKHYTVMGVGVGGWGVAGLDPGVWLWGLKPLPQASDLIFNTESLYTMYSVFQVMKVYE